MFDIYYGCRTTTNIESEKEEEKKRNKNTDTHKRSARRVFDIQRVIFARLTLFFPKHVCVAMRFKWALFATWLNNQNDKHTIKLCNVLIYSMGARCVYYSFIVTAFVYHHYHLHWRVRTSLLCSHFNYALPAFVHFTGMAHGSDK